MTSFVFMTNLILMAVAVYLILSYGRKIQEAKGADRCAKISFLCGILSILFVSTFIGAAFAGVFGIMNGMRAKKMAGQMLPTAKVGILLSAVGLLLAVLLLAGFGYLLLAVSAMT